MNLLLTHTDPDGITPVILLNLINEEFKYLTFEPTEISKFIIEKLNTTLSKDSDITKFDKFTKENDK